MTASSRTDAMVLGGGIVGVSIALHLQERGLRVALVDRRQPGCETSYGNAGFIETSAILPHPFPQGIGNLLRLATNRSDSVRTDHAFLPRLLAWLLAYKRASSNSALEAIGPSFRHLMRASLPEHRHLLEQAGAADLYARMAGSNCAGHPPSFWRRTTRPRQQGHRVSGSEVGGECPPRA